MYWERLHVAIRPPARHRIYIDTITGSYFRPHGDDLTLVGIGAMSDMETSPDDFRQNNDADFIELARKRLAQRLPRLRRLCERHGMALWAGLRLAPPFDAGQRAHLAALVHKALQLALDSEQRAVRFFDRIAGSSKDAKVRAAARQLASEERQHVRLVKEWMQKVPKPEAGWDYDPDPPNYTE